MNNKNNRKNRDNSNYLFFMESVEGENTPDTESEYEDIISSSEVTEDIYSLSSFSTGGRYAKKKRGFLAKIASWWKNRKKWQKAVMISVTSLVVVLGIVVGIFLNTFDYNYNHITQSPEKLGFENIINEDIVNVALFGLDTRDKNSFKGNTDSIMVLSLNTKTKKVKIVSLMRDTLVPITNKGKTSYRKINSAYASGGPELAIKTINNILGLDISEYATVNFYGMVDIIDAVGGIDAELTQAEVGRPDGTLHQINGCIDEICGNLGLDSRKYHIFTPGKQHLNGVQAVAYSRIRYVANIWGTNNDYGRTDRQRYVMEQLFNKAVKLDKTKYVKLAKSLIPCSETSLSYSEIMGLAFDILLHSPTFDQARLPVDGMLMPSPNAGVGSVVYYDLDFAKKLIHSFIYDDISFESYIEEHGIEKNDWYGRKFGHTSKPSGSNGTTVTQQPPKNEESTKPSTGNDTGSDTPSTGTTDNPSTGDTGTSGGTTGGTTGGDTSGGTSGGDTSGGTTGGDTSGGTTGGTTGGDTSGGTSGGETSGGTTGGDTSGGTTGGAGQTGGAQ